MIAAFCIILILFIALRIVTAVLEPELEKKINDLNKPKVKAPTDHIPEDIL